MGLVTTLLGGSILGFVTTLIGQIVKAKGEQQKMMIAGLQARADIVQRARDHGKTDRTFAWTRRVIALICVFVIVVVPFVAPFFNVPVMVSFVQEGGLNLPFIWEAPNNVQWQEINGIPLAPMYLHTLAAIISFYFGSSAAR
tara:strand:+ start:55 stop:480 length:426 start_codon:yes stop_codon:yes gene_type:complete